MVLRFTVVLWSMGLVAVAQENPAAKITTNRAVTEADGTVRMQRVVPLPQGLSPEAKAWLSRPMTTDAEVPQTMEQRRAALDLSQARHRDALLKIFPVTVTEGTVAGVPVREVVPTTMKHKDRVLICLHGGGFNADSGSYSTHGKDSCWIVTLIPGSVADCHTATCALREFFSPRGGILNARTLSSGSGTLSLLTS